MDQSDRPFRIEPGSGGPELRLRMKELRRLGAIASTVAIVGLSVYALREANPFGSSGPVRGPKSLAPAPTPKPLPPPPAAAPAASIALAPATPDSSAPPPEPPKGEQVVAQRVGEELPPGAIEFPSASHGPARPLSEKRVRSMFRSPVGGGSVENDDSFEGAEDQVGWKVFRKDGSIEVSEVEPKIAGDRLTYRKRGARAEASIPVVDVDLELTFHPANRFRAKFQRA